MTDYAAYLRYLGHDGLANLHRIDREMRAYLRDGEWHNSWSETYHLAHCFPAHEVGIVVDEIADERYNEKGRHQWRLRPDGQAL